MEQDDALSFALKKLAEDVVKECDQRNVSNDENDRYPQKELAIPTDTAAYTHETTYTGQSGVTHETSGAFPPARSLLPPTSGYPGTSTTGEQMGGGPTESCMLPMVEPPPNIDPRDPSFLAIKDAFVRCLSEIQNLKLKLSDACDEIRFLKQEYTAPAGSRERPELRDIGTETDTELLLSAPLKTEECSADNADDERSFPPTDAAAEHPCGDESAELPDEKPEDGEFVGDFPAHNDSESSSSPAAEVIQKRRKRKRQVVLRVTKQNLLTSEDEEEDFDSGDNYVDDGEFVDFSDGVAQETVADSNPHGGSPPLKPSKRKANPRKQSKPKKKKKTSGGFHACEICFKSYNRPIDLRKHMLTHSKNDNDEYECSVCKETFAKFPEFAAHHKTHQSVKDSPPTVKAEPTEFPCSLCGKVFAERDELRRHKKSHPKECPVCNVSISSKNYSVHVRGHTGEKPYKCQQCAMAFVGPRHLARHMRIHTGEKPYTCTVCNKAFSEAGALRTHARRHTGERPYICETCGKAFAQLTGLTYHIRTHTGEKPYQCDVCKKRFAQVTGLENHKRTHTGEKPYCCDICGRCFAVAITFTQHKRTHTGEKPYKCDLCGRAFTTGGALHRHKVIHAGVKPHVCVVCGVAFARLGDLQRHVRIHTGVRPFKCETCGKSFSRRSHLQAHGKTHSDKKKPVLPPPHRAAPANMEASNAVQRLERSVADRPMDSRALERLVEHQHPGERTLERTLERAMARPGAEQRPVSSLPQRVDGAHEAPAPVYLGGGRGMEEMPFTGRPVFPDRVPISHERHAITPDSTTSYQERGPAHPGGERVDEQHARAGHEQQERAASVHERPVSLQEFMPGLPHPQLNMPPGAYPQWNFSFQ